MVSLVDQLYAFGMTIVAGLVMGVVFDLFRVLRGSARPRSVLTWAGDILYWVSVTPLVAAVLLHANRGELRFYVVLGIGVGLTLYFTVCSLVVLETLRLVSRTVGFAVSWIVHLALSVATWPVLMLRRMSYTWRARHPGPGLVPPGRPAGRGSAFHGDCPWRGADVDGPERLPASRHHPTGALGGLVGAGRGGPASNISTHASERRCAMSTAEARTRTRKRIKLRPRFFVIVTLLFLAFYTLYGYVSGFARMRCPAPGNRGGAEGNRGTGDA